MSRPAFASLEDANGQGEVLRVVQEGDAGASINGQLGFAFKDSSGNVILPQLDSAGRIAVTFATGTCLKAQGKTGAGSPEATLVAVASITLTVDEIYKDIEFHVGGPLGGYYVIEHLDDATVNVLDEIYLDSGQYTFRGSQKCMEITAGSSGSQELRIRAYNWGTGSGQQDQLAGSISCLQVA